MQFDEAGEIIVPVMFYFAAPCAPVFPGFHLYATDYFQSHAQPGLGPGLRWDSIPTYYNGALPWPANSSGRFCGSLDWWQNGVPSNAPPVDYGNGFPACCGQPCQPYYPVPYTQITFKLFPDLGLTWVNNEDAPGIISTWLGSDGESVFQIAFGAETYPCQEQPMNMVVGVTLGTTGEPGLLFQGCYNPDTYTGTYYPYPEQAATSPLQYVTVRIPP
jgi:hypothetical protein